MERRHVGTVVVALEGAITATCACAVLLAVLVGGRTPAAELREVLAVAPVPLMVVGLGFVMTGLGLRRAGAVGWSVGVAGALQVPFMGAAMALAIAVL